MAPSVLAQEGPPPAPVCAAAVEVREIQDRRMITGELHAVRRSRVAARESGAVIEYPLLEGARVEGGALLARIDSRELTLELEEARAQKLAAEALLDERRAERDWREEDLRIILDLREQGASNPKELLDAESSLAVARARVTETERQLSVIQAGIALLDEKIRETEVIAPFSGIVIARHTEVGEWVSEGDPVVELLSTDELEVHLDVPARYYDSVQQDLGPVVVRFEDAGRDLEIESKRILPQIVRNAQTFRLILPIDNSAGAFAPGMAVVAWVPVSGLREEMLVPRDAVLRNEVGAYVFAVVPTGPDGPSFAMPVRVDVVYALGGDAVVRSDELREGGLVVIEGNERLFPHAPVSPIVEGAADPAGENFP